MKLFLPLPGGALSVITNLYKRVQSQPYWLASLVITALLVALRQIGGLQSLELLAFDYMTRLQHDQGPDSRLLVVEVTEQDIRDLPEWPISDQVMSELLIELQKHNPTAIGLDIYRDIPQGEGYESLVDVLQSPEIIAIESLGIGQDDDVPAPAAIAPDQVGFNDFVIDPDGILRRSMLFAALGEEKLYSFALRLSLKYLEGKNQAFSVNQEALTIGETDFTPLQPNSGGYDNIDALSYQMLLDYRSSSFVARTVRLSEVLAGEVAPGWIENKVVLIGVTAPSKKDFFYTPYSSEKDGEHVMAGVVVHAQMVSQILSSVLDETPIFWYLPNSVEIGWIWLWSMAGGFLVWRMKRSALLGVALLASAAGLGGICFVSFALTGWVPFAAPLLGLFLTSGALITYQVFYQSFYDLLTGLPNRALFVRQLKRTLERNSQNNLHASCAILLLDLDHFKAINESFGHQFGDQLLTKAAERIRGNLPVRTSLARLGGDEFAILLTDLTEASQATKIADTLYNHLAEPFDIDEQSITTSFSIGIALNQSDQANQAETLMQDAHRAMARARALGKDHYEIFDPGMRTEAVKRFQLEAELRSAIDNQEFLLYYQPIINLQSGKLAGFEALVRWQHPQRGFVSPGSFIPAAEDTGLIVPMGSWILEEACSQMYAWQQQFPQAEGLMVSVNLSTKQFNQANLTEEVASILEKTQLDSQCLKLELTESAAMEDVNGTIEQLMKLKSLNLKLSLDDFGTGYSSLSYLHQLPTDTLKVDQSFVGRMEEKTRDDGEIVKTIISLGHQLGMDVIAEGIETAAQLQGLRDLSCNYGQGYYFAKPLPEEAAMALVAENKNWLADADTSEDSPMAA
ncbi:MAG: EAL domain-containing protein [Cyanobacteria bacterium J06621_11]